MITNEMLSYVRSELSKGLNNDAIKQNLIQGGGWSESDANEVFNVIQGHKKSSHSNLLPILSVVVILLIVGAVGVGTYYYFLPIQSTNLSEQPLSSPAVIESDNSVNNATSSPFISATSSVSADNTIDNPTGKISSDLQTNNISNQGKDDVPQSPSASYGNMNVVIISQPEYIKTHEGLEIILSIGVGELLSDQKITLIPDLHVEAQVKNDDTGEVVMNTILTDDNINGYGPAHDGKYFAMPITDLKPADYHVYYTVTGKDIHGKEITHKSISVQESTYITISSGDAQFIKLDDESIDITGNGKADIINVGFWLDAKKAGGYIVSATFVCPNGQEIGRSGQFSLMVGAQRVSLMLDSRDNGDKMSNGVYKIKDISLFETDSRVHWVDDWFGDEGTYTTKNYTVR
ncbi:MAG: hypothetical protein ABI430_04645 [Candidatus Taylorbacteria bacterium]